MCITIRYLYMCLSHSEQIRYAESFSSKKNTLRWYVPIDSVICWSENILPVIKTNNRNDENYFLLQLQLANAYTLRGDISLAIDRARLMYEEAKETEYEFRNCSCQPSHRRCLHHSQSMRQSIGFVPGCFKGIKPSLAATSLPDTTLIKDIQCFTT